MPTTLETASAQEDILLSLVQGDEGKIWASNVSGWDKNFTYGVCYWDFIFCDEVTSQDVIRILIENGGLKGTIPSELGMLHELKEVSFPNNILNGTIPEEITTLPKLEVVNLQNNQISGDMAHFKSASLRRVIVGNNSLVGTINLEIGSYNPLLETLDISHNNITGPIPSTLSQCKNLGTLDLSDNQLTGFIPFQLGNCKKIIKLDLSHNNLLGSIPPQLATKDVSLEGVWLNHNLLSGTIPASFVDLENLKHFHVDGNKFTGTVPKELCDRLYAPDISEEMVDGEEVLAEPLESDTDYCDYIACSPGSYSNNGLFPCEKCSNDQLSPYLGHYDNCYKSDPESILKEFYELTSGPEWKDVEHPWTNGDKCDYTGIVCDEKKHVLEINLSGKGLCGPLPSSIGFLHALKVLDVSDNHLTGFVPSDLRWPPLETLDISGNEFISFVPPELCLEEGVNGNGKDGKYSCRTIACPAGTYSSKGYGLPLSSVSAPADKSVACLPCPSAKFIGSKSCNFTKIISQTQRNSATLPKEVIFSIFLMTMFSLGACLYVSYLRVRDRNYKKRKANAMRESEEWTVDNYDNELSTLQNSIKSSTESKENNDGQEDKLERSLM